MCSALWEAADVDEINQEAVDAYNALHAWVIGFRKNSRGAGQPIYIWQHDGERREFAVLTEDFRASPFVLRHGLKIGAFPIKALPPSSRASPPPSSETVSAPEVEDLPSPSPDETASAAHRRFLGIPPSLPPAVEPVVLLEVSTQAGKTSTSCVGDVVLPIEDSVVNAQTAQAPEEHVIREKPESDTASLSQISDLLSSKFQEFGASMNARFSAMGAEFLAFRQEIDSRFLALEQPIPTSANQPDLDSSV